MIHFPLQHISIRVPWHDLGWNGSVCKCPSRNTSCLKLKNIYQNKDEQAESDIAGQSIEGLSQEKMPPCVKERATFMADFGFTRLHEHPYAKSSPTTHSHFAQTRLEYPAFSAAALPFRWMMKKAVFEGENDTPPLRNRFPLEGLDQGVEISIEEKAFKTAWLQDHHNHRTLLDCFWNHVRVEESLVFFYAKQVPLVEDTGRRILIGVGKVKSIGSLTEYDYNTPTDGKIRSLLWERMIGHSIRPDFSDGFIMPYHQALEASDNGKAFDPSEVVAFAPEDRFYEFSYATEHVGQDPAIESLLSCRAALVRSSQLFNVDIRKQEEWIDKELGRLWKKRGPFPGMGALLTAHAFPMGHFIAETLTQHAGEGGNPWLSFDAMLEAPSQFLPSELAQPLDQTIISTWKRIRSNNGKLADKHFYELASRIALTDEQARLLTIPEVREETGIETENTAYLENPYLIYEDTRFTTSPVSIEAVDRGVFPSTFIRENVPLAEPTMVKNAVDSRRLRALTVRELETASSTGHTLLPVADVVRSLRSSEEQRKLNDTASTDVTADLLETAEEIFDEVIIRVRMADEKPAYQLKRLSQLGHEIRTKVTKSLSEKAIRHDLAIDWRAELNNFLDKGEAVELDELEERARCEKSAALAELASSRFSVLIGPAGTGKTTLLSVLCQHKDISTGRILLLAPTGKARVRMEDVARSAGSDNYQARTVAQHLSRSHRYVGELQRYILNDEPADKVGETVIIDECSMLTEDMLAALFQSLRGVQRMILVGDPRQLPPIGTGRPFADIVSELCPEDHESSFPRVARGFAELTIPRRQGSGNRDDLLLASWFGGSSTQPSDDDVFEILAGQRKSDTIQFVKWDSPDDLEQMIPPLLAEHLSFDTDLRDDQSFSCANGATLSDNGSAWFNNAYGDRGGAGKSAEAWQILCPVRAQPWGVDHLNCLIHQRYKGDFVEWCRNQKYLSVPRPAGEHQIVYGDKVINNRNWRVHKSRIYPKSEDASYLANGEIGIVVGHRKTKKRNWKPEGPEIEFSTQTGKVFKFYQSDFKEEGDAALELAYALTIHKSQGSEFGVVFLVLPEASPLLTRELLYTALTRQRQKVIILHQGDVSHLHRLSQPHYSATATRLTNLFSPPNPVEFRGEPGKFFEHRLIHRSTKGIALRSKSEVIIANMMEQRGIDFAYEQPLEFGGLTKYPDFTIEDDDTGQRYYWEHCGMLHVESYRKNWERKLKWYQEHGITESGGPNGQLIITRDAENGSFDSEAITRHLDELA